MKRSEIEKFEVGQEVDMFIASRLGWEWYEPNRTNPTSGSPNLDWFGDDASIN
jgi:hypothetical protein